jgi:hemerythrin-like domain-containing protein
VLLNISPSGEPTPDRGDVVDLLTACHQRIRFFIDLAVRLSESGDASNDQIHDAAARIVRYFSESLPLHVADEEESIVPRLSGRRPELDRTLDAMHREHEEHETPLQRLLQTCGTLQESPEQLPELRESLRDVASTLSKVFDAHLRQEEEIVLPAIRSLLSDKEQETMLSELRARRGKGDGKERKPA